MVMVVSGLSTNIVLITCHASNLHVALEHVVAAVQSLSACCPGFPADSAKQG